MIEVNTSPLPADPARQATAMLSACEYQILQTVNAWLDLRSSDALYVEGAEDFDVASPGGAEAVQVKTSPDPISLGQHGIQITISQFWALKSRAAGRNVRFKYLTRAPFTVERSKPFGEDVAGLELWQKRSISEEEIGYIRDFLLEQKAIAENLKRWLRCVTEEEIRSQLLNSISWETQAEDFSGAERSVWCKLLAFAEHRDRVPASVIKRIARRLKEEVWNCLRQQGERRLDQFRLEELWEEETCVSIPHTALLARFNMPPSGQSLQHRDAVRLLRVGLPPLPGIVARRDVYVASLRKVLSKSRVLLLHGSSRMGKTTLAKLIAESEADSWRWCTFRCSRREEIPRTLEMLTREIALDSNIVDVVLDDIDLSAGTSLQGEESLTEIVALVQSRRGRLLITSQRELSVRLAHSNGISAEQIVSVPRLEPYELIEFASSLGCPAPGQCSIWGRIVHVSTAGHPQLAAARLFALMKEGWPPATSEALNFGLQAVEAERTEALQVLTSSIDEHGRALLIRLSSFPFSFRRDHGLELGAVRPPIGYPGAVLDALIGPWIEPLHEGYYSLSPLLNNLAEHTLAVNDLRSLQNTAARTLLECNPCNQMDFGQAFLLFWKTKNVGALAKLVDILLGFDEELASALAEELWWFTIIADRPGQCLYEENASLSLLLRPLQLRIASRRSPDRVGELVEAWRWELDNIEHPEPVLMRVAFSMFVLINPEIRIRASEVVRALKDVKDAVAAYPDLSFPTEVPRGDRPEFAYMPKWNDPVATLSFTCSAHCENLRFFEDLLNELECLETGVRNSILTGFVCSGLEVQMALDRVWLKESEREKPDWEHCLSVFQKGRELGLKWSCPWLATASMRASIVVIDEYLQDHSRAHRMLDQMVAPGDLLAHAVHDRRACIYFSESNYSSAELEWRKALEVWPETRAPFDSHSAYAARSAGVSAARQSRWSEAANWFKLCIHRLPEKRQDAFIAGCLADAGYCLWLSEAKKDAVGSLIDAWQLADTLPVGKEDLLAFKTRKTIGHVIAWIHGTATDFGTGDLQEPVAGTCSTLELPEWLRELPETESENVWLFLKRIERELGAGTRAAELGDAIIAGTKSLVTGSIAALDGVASLLASGDVSGLPGAIIEMARKLGDARSKVPGYSVTDRNYPDPEILDESSLLCGKTVFVAGLIAGRGVGSDWHMVLDQWRLSIPTEAKEGWIEWFDTIENTMSESAAAAERLAKSGEGGWELSLLAAWSLLENKRVTAEQLYVGHARIVAQPHQFYWLREVSRAFCLHVERRWLQFSECPALLCMPRVSVEAIHAACASSEPGIPKAARILLASSNAVKMKLPIEMMAAIRILSEGVDPHARGTGI
jgi:tetratricopeptide (TPR) repeat protein